MVEHRAYGGRNKERDNIWWHGSVSGDMRGGKTGLHLGTRAAAEDALHATIGFPVEGTWDGTRDYYKTLLAGKKRIKAMNPYGLSGRNVRAPDEDYYAHEHPEGLLTYSNGDPVPMDVKPSIKPFRITGNMTNTIDRPHGDFKANGYMQAALKKGNAKNGYFYRNDGEDYGSISAVVPGPGHIQPVNEADITKAEGGEVDEPGITAYHGTPHDFERFDMSKIGTGEGNQSYGHGLYFAQNEDVAKGYRDTLGGHHPGDVVIGDEKHPHWASRNIINAYRKLGYDNETAVLASHFLKEHKGDLNAAAAATWSNDKIPDSVADALFKTEYATPAGHMYEVNINAHPDHFLDWDKPFHEQSEHVKRSLRNVPEFDDRVARYGVLDPEHKSKISMGEFINRGVLPHSYDKSGPEFSNAYRAAGIKGVKYLDQGSRWGEKKDKTHNYVVFDDKLVNVKRKYAEGGSVDEYPLDADADEHKHSGGHMSWMSPNSFLDKAQEMQGDSDDKHAIKHFEKRIKEGDKLNPLALYPKGGQDGRHRATAAKHLGIDKIPVVQWPKKRNGGSIVDRALMLTSKKA
jgi:hypothetical protein